MALQRAAAVVRNAATGFTSSNALVSTTQTPTAVALAASIPVGTVNNVSDHSIQVTANVGAITPSAATLINVYAYASIDGTIWPGSAAAAELVNGTDKTLTLSTLGHNMRWIGSFLAHTASTAITSNEFSLAAAFGVLPAAYQIVVQNATTLAFTAAGCTVTSVETYYT